MEPCQLRFLHLSLHILTLTALAVSYTWQSEGRCFGNCTDLNYAFAVLNNYDCWCSNVVPNPDDQKPVEECQFPCPGYPTDYCGGNGGLFGYLEIAANKPTATAPAGFGLSASTSTTSSVSSPLSV
jgi:cell wall integrity and stress response component